MLSCGLPKFSIDLSVCINNKCLPGRVDRVGWIVGKKHVFQTQPEFSIRWAFLITVKKTKLFFR